MTATPDRIVFTVAVGGTKYGEMAMGLGRSLALIGDPTPRVVLTDIEGFEWERYFSQVIRRTVPRDELFWAKFYALEYTNASEILFVDGDSLCFKKLDPIYTACRGSSFGVQGVLAKDGEWYGKGIPELCLSESIEALPKFNGGLLYYERGPDINSLVELARSTASRYDEIGWRRNENGSTKGIVADEPLLALAMAKTGIGKVLPDNENFHNSAVGLVGKLRMDVLKNECRYLCRRYDLQHVEPFIFHAHFYSKFLIYWNQLEALKMLEQPEKQYSVERRSVSRKLSHSIQRSMLKLRGSLG